MGGRHRVGGLLCGLLWLVPKVDDVLARICTEQPVRAELKIYLGSKAVCTLAARHLQPLRLTQAQALLEQCRAC